MDNLKGFPTRTFVCSRCGREKEIIMNHDGINETYERCVDLCMWTNYEGPMLFTSQGQQTGFKKCKFIKKSLILDQDELNKI